MGKTWGRDVFIIGMAIMKWMWFITCTRKTSGHPCLENISMTCVYSFVSLTNWSRVTNICVSRLTIIGSDNGLSPGRRQAIIWSNDGILLIGPLGTNFSEVSIEIYIFSFWKMHLKMLSGKWRPFCPGLNVLKQDPISHSITYQERYAKST